MNEVTISVWANESEAQQIQDAFPCLQIQESEWHGAGKGCKLAGKFPANALEKHRVFGSAIIVAGTVFPVRIESELEPQAEHGDWGWKIRHGKFGVDCCFLTASYPDQAQAWQEFLSNYPEMGGCNADS